MTQSSWEQLKLRSNYHFDPEVMDPLYDTVDRVGQLHLALEQAQLDSLVEESQEATWRTRGNPKKESKVRGEDEFIQEDYDLEKTGYGKDYVVSNLNWEVPANLQAIAESGHHPRITLQVTGVRTEKSKEFIRKLRKGEL